MTQQRTVPRRNKSRAIKTTYRGRVYDSKLEARYAQHLDLLIEARVIRGWIPQPERLPLVVNGTKIGVYTPDFKVFGMVNDNWFVDTKGFIPKDWPFRLKVIRACYPHLDLRIVTSKDF